MLAITEPNLDARACVLARLEGRTPADSRMVR
jgi:hypothetical protein